ncbi:MAG TPA: hypothetical protein VN851_19115 [Thermoanaerobaculia bacterium]|nr:hypothetical protein [Thermoanaerobaculia bacterium]
MVAQAVAPAPESYLVRRTAHIDDEISGLKFDLEMVIYRDGLLVRTLRFPDSTELLRARGTPQEVRDLQRALSQNRFGSQAGRCFYRDQPGQGEVFRSAVTWFGRTGERQVTLTFGNPFTALCSEAFVRSVDAISDFFFAAAQEPGTQIEMVPADIFGDFKPEPRVP